MFMKFFSPGVRPHGWKSHLGLDPDPGVCMKVRFKSKVTGGLSLLAASRLVFPAVSRLKNCTAVAQRLLNVPN